MTNKAIIWDLDGTIADTQDFHAQVESEILSDCQIEITPQEITRKYAGRRFRDWFREIIVKDLLLDDDFLKRKGIHPDLYPMQAEQLKWGKISLSLLYTPIETMPGADNLIRAAYEKKILQAVASSSPRDYVQSVLSKLGLIKYFAAIVTGDDIKKGKPDPEIFLNAANLINVKPKYCVVIEDSLAGMTGSKAARMKCVAYDPYARYDSKSLPADLTIRGFRKLSLEVVINL